jgi:hypothetical protein
MRPDSSINPREGSRTFVPQFWHPLTGVHVTRIPPGILSIDISQSGVSGVALVQLHSTSTESLPRIATIVMKSVTSS